ncbi:MAG: hypothetical protein J6T35_08095 [Bacteroidales bacterium]|nr:hypothetical protein [Bacteroidales bacterium]
MRPLVCLVPALLASMFFFVHARAQEPASVRANGAPAKKADSLKVNNFNLDLNFLTHGEICAGGLPKDTVDDDLEVDKSGTSAFLLGRVRLILGYQRKWLEAKLVTQNVAIWGMRSNMTMNLYEGWIKAKAPFGLFGQVGRIALSYDDERIIGANDFATAALSHDVLRIGYEGHGHQAHIILAYNQNGENVYGGSYYVGGAQAYKTMQTVWYHYDIPKFPLGISLLFMNMGLQAGQADKPNNPARVEYQQIFGGYIKSPYKYLNVEASYYKQRGKTIVGDNLMPFPIDAWMASAKVTGYPIEQLGITLGYDYLSGDDYVPVLYGGRFGMILHSVYKGFTPLYGSRTKFYGILDYFYESAYSHGFTPGLQNAYIGVSGQPFANFTCGLTYHYLMVATQLQDLSSTLGHSLEAKLGYAFTKDISFNVGYTFMLGTETMRCLKDRSDSGNGHWAWFSLVVSPTLFKTKF